MTAPDTSDGAGTPNGEAPGACEASDASDASGATASDARSDVARGRERRCLVSREVGDPERLIRFVLDPGGVVTPDLAQRLPGRGAWVTSERACVDAAVKKGLFARAFKRAVTAPADLSDQIEAQLLARCLAQLGMARRAGGLVAGFDQVRALAKSAKPAYIVEASDGASDGRGKTLGMARAVWGDDIPVAGCFTAAQIGGVLGRDRVAHAALMAGHSSRGFEREARRLAGFRALFPEEWNTHDG